MGGADGSGRFLVIRSPKSTTKVQVWPSPLLNSLADGAALLNTVMKCGGIESEDDPKTHF